MIIHILQHKVDFVTKLIYNVITKQKSTKVNKSLTKILFFLSILVLYNCSDETLIDTVVIEESQAEIEDRTLYSPSFSVLNGRVVFDNEGDYNATLDYLGSILTADALDQQSTRSENDVLDEWESDLAFTSYRKDFIQNYPPSPTGFDNDDLPIPDVILTTLLKTDKIFQVTPWIFKLEPNLRQVFVLNIADINLMQVLIDNNEFNDYQEIQTFSFDDEVFALLPTDNQEEQAFRWGCNERGAPGQDADSGDEYCEIHDENWWYSYKIKYDRFGIKESLWVRFKHKNDKNPFHDTSFDMQYSGNYKPRCRTKKNFSKSFSGFCGNAGFSMVSVPYRGYNRKFRLYNASRALSAYYLQSSARFTSRCEIACCDYCVHFSKLVPTPNLTISYP